MKKLFISQPMRGKPMKRFLQSVKMLLRVLNII